MDPNMAALVALQYPDHVVGFKVANYIGQEPDPVYRLIEAGERANLPVMVDFFDNGNEMSLEELLTDWMRPGKNKYSITKKIMHMLNRENLAQRPLSIFFFYFEVL